ncbi:MAG: flagellar biosynthesis protein FlhG [Halanaerobiales bacterium]|nr:flagellar biosynthesis protein FlhG [Halanaerobiales bacterium]
MEGKKRNTRIIAIASGKGGVGKTNISLNLGLALQELGERVLLLDADLGMANVDILLGLTPRYNLSHVLKGRCKFAEALLEGPGGIDILPGTSGVEELVNISSLEVMRLLDASSQMEENYDIILLDVGAGIHQSVTNFIMASDEVIIVLTPEPTSIMDAYSLIKILANRKFKNNMGLLINQTSSRKEGNEVAVRMKKVIKEYLDLDIKILGYIPYDTYVRQSVKEQTPFLIRYPKANAGEAIRDVASGMLNRVRENDSRGMKGFIFRLVGIFNRNPEGEN